MSIPFLITGLPRSRTAWMATAATGEDAICLHEPTKWLDRWEDVFSTVWVNRSDCRFIGISDHGLGFHLAEIMRRRAPRTLIIQRPIDEVKISLAALGLPPSSLIYHLAEALTFQHPNIRRIAYSDLADSAAVVDCLQWLMPGAAIDADRIAWLQRSNIQADIASTLRLAHLRRHEAHKFIPASVLARVRGE